MNGISAVGSSLDYSKIASGKRINSAADDAAGLAIAKKLEKQATGLAVGASNAQEGKGVLNIADGALGGMNDYLQRIRELSVKASSGLQSADSLQSIQNEINQNLAGIQDLAKGTEYNGMKLLDGSMADIGIATNPDGSGMKIQMSNSTLEMLGIDGYDVTKGFDISKIDKAIEMVSSSRSSMGAAANGLGYAFNYNEGASLEQTGAQSKLEDLDIAKAVSEQKKEEVLEQYKNNMLKNQMEETSLVSKLL